MEEFVRSNITNIEILQCSGEITIKNVEQFKEEIFEFIQSDNEKLLLNLSNTSYMNSAALGHIAGAAIAANKNNKKFVIGGIQPNIQEIFRIIKFEVFITLFNEIEDAYLYFRD